MASSSDSPSNSKKWKWTYDVFLSFRGSDVRKGFIGHLYAALVREKIHTFYDEDKIDYGQEIGPACVKGIRESRLALVILSQDYANSSWCLEELLHILQCKKPEDICPIFYDLDPSDVQGLTGSYGKAFDDYKTRFKEDVLNQCKDSFRQISHLEGLDLQKHLDGHEAKNIDHIVKEILMRLNRASPSVAIPPVGLNSRANEVISLIADEQKDVRIIGIYGMGGIGKTTIAKEVYNKLSHKFESRCFLENVRELFVSKGVAYLQRQLLTATLKRKHEKINNVDRGLNVIIERLRHKRVLLVLDDVDNVVQLNKILGKRDWFFPGSRVIITTRIKDFLQPSELYWQHDVKELGDDNSLQLLKLHAFDKSCPMEDYLDCAEKMVSHAGGVPLALEVLGSSLSGQNIDVWNSRLEKLKVIGNEDIYSKLRISYDSLDDTEKFIFLDIACFFIGFDKDYVISILDGCRFFPIDGINTLMRRCLVKVGSDNKLVMHDLIRDMGRKIVKQNLTDPGEHSRLWDHEDVINVLTDKMGTKAVEGLVLNMPGLKHSWSTKAFKKMKMLRLLQLNHVRLKGSFEYISSKLRWLCWHEFPLGSIPSELYLENLIALDMRYSNLKKFSEEGKSLRKLKFLNLSYSHELIETPDFEGCPKLEKLMLKDCTKLGRVHNSIGLLSNLLLLNLQDCKNLKNLPGSIGDLRSLEQFNMAGCSKLEELPTSIGFLSRLFFLNLQDCENLKNLPESIGNVKALEELNLSGCSTIDGLPESIGLLSHLTFLNLQDCKNLKNLPGSIGDLRSLEQFNMAGCSKLEELPTTIGLLSCLFFLNLQDCENLKNLPESIGNVKALEELNLSGCSTIDELPESIGLLSQLTFLNLKGCKNLKNILESIAHLKSLNKLRSR